MDAQLVEGGALKAQCRGEYRKQESQIRLYDDVEKLLRVLHRYGKKIAIPIHGCPNGQRRKGVGLELTALVDEILIMDKPGDIQFRKVNNIGFRILKYRVGVS